MNSTDYSSVSDYYAGKSIFITGGTGFVGKVLLEKLLYTCVDIDKIYILIRGNKTATGEQRWQEIIRKPIFERIRKMSPHVFNKVITVTGDIADHNLGINSKEEKSFIDKVSVVFHSAASVRFNEELGISVNVNYEATKRMLNLCHRMKNLQSFVYISTAFVHPQNTNLQEIVYPAPVDPKTLQDFMEQKGMVDEEKLAKFMQRGLDKPEFKLGFKVNPYYKTSYSWLIYDTIYGGSANTYTFAKALAENYVAENHGTISTVIVRPSIVTSAANDPIPGWVDSWSGAAAVVGTTALGYNRVVVGKGANTMDLIPVDFVTNLSIVAAAKNSKDNLEIFNCCTSACNPLSLKDMSKITRKCSMTNGYNDVPIPFAVMTKDGMMKEILVFLLEKLPAITADLYMQMRGRKPRYVKLQSKMTSNRELLKFFTSRSYAMSADKTVALSRSLSEKDAKLFPFNPKQINWGQYLPVYIQGIRKYLLRK